MRRRARRAAPPACLVPTGPAPPSRPPVRASLSILALSPSRSPFQNPRRAPELPRSPTRSAGVKLPHCHPISQFPPPAALPCTPASLALTRGCRRQGEGRAWPPPFSPARTLPRSRGPPRRRAIPPFALVRLSVVSTLAPPAPPGGLAVDEHRSVELLPCFRVPDPWAAGPSRSGRWQLWVHSTGCTQRLRPTGFLF